VNYLGWLVDGANWGGPQGITQRLIEHLGYTALTMVIALVVAVPLGSWIGHRSTSTGGFVVSGANGLRALPTLGLLVLLVTWIGLGFTGPLIALLVLGIPPILAGTYAGIRNVDRAIVDAATGMGMRGKDVLLKVELPNALPLIIGGIRSSLLQVVSTATIAAYVGLGGLGRFIFDGLAQRDFPQMIGGSILVAVLAVALDLVFGGLQKLLVSPGLQAAPRGPRRLRAVPSPKQQTPAAEAA
jgi:osmoprotectant transport system permease protein